MPRKTGLLKQTAWNAFMDSVEAYGGLDVAPKSATLVEQLIEDGDKRPLILDNKAGKEDNMTATHEFPGDSPAKMVVRINGKTVMAENYRFKYVFEIGGEYVSKEHGGEKRVGVSRLLEAGRYIAIVAIKEEGEGRRHGERVMKIESFCSRYLEPERREAARPARVAKRSKEILSTLARVEAKLDMIMASLGLTYDDHASPSPLNGKGEP